MAYSSFIPHRCTGRQAAAASCKEICVKGRAAAPCPSRTSPVLSLQVLQVLVMCNGSFNLRSVVLYPIQCLMLILMFKKAFKHEQHHEENTVTTLPYFCLFCVLLSLGKLALIKLIKVY